MTWWDDHEHAEKDSQKRVELLYENLLERTEPYLETLKMDALRSFEGLKTGMVFQQIHADETASEYPLVIPKHAISLIVAMTAGGKTTLMSNLAVRLVRNGYNGFFLTLEEPGFQINAKILSADSKFENPNHSVLSLTTQDAVKVLAGKESYDGMEGFNRRILSKIRVLDANKSVDVNKISAASVLFEPQYLMDIIQYRNSKCKRPLDFVFIDYVQLMRADDEVREMASFQRIKSIMQAMKNLCGQLGIAVIMGAQLNRTCIGVSVWDWTREMMREGADIEQSATLMLAIANDSKATDPYWSTAIRFLKNRYGPQRVGGLFNVDWGHCSISDVGRVPNARS